MLKKTPTGSPSTDLSTLTELATDYELPRLVLDHRSLAKLRSTYAEKLPRMVDSRTGRIHTTYHQVQPSCCEEEFGKPLPRKQSHGRSKIGS